MIPKMFYNHHGNTLEWGSTYGEFSFHKTPLHVNSSNRADHFYRKNLSIQPFGTTIIKDSIRGLYSPGYYLGPLYKGPLK